MMLGLNYTNSVRLAGGIPCPFAIPIKDNSEETMREAINEYLEFLDGVLIIGGPDLDPVLYDEQKLPTVGLMSKFRERFDITLAKECLARRMPVLGICLGCQVLNVAAGGSLYQDIANDFPEWNIRHGKKLEAYFTFHNVNVEKDSALGRILGVDTLETNSAHHQSVKVPGDGFRIVARAEDGIVEAIEKTDGSFALGIQWHPEYLAASRPTHLKIFQALISAAMNK